MSILIKGMTMPETCMYGGCPIDGKYCDLWWKMGGGEYSRHRDCPLVELPDHGDLIDRDELMKHKGSAYDIDGHELYAVATGTILRMPAVIPAERSEAGPCDDCDERNIVSCSRCRRMERSEE